MEPSDSSAWRRALTSLEDGADWRVCFEELLRSLDAASAERLQLTMREGRGGAAAWLGTTGGVSAFLGDPLSGTPVALAALGHRVLCVATPEDFERVRLAQHRNRALAPGRIRIVVAKGERLPLGSGAVEALVWERSGALPNAVEGELRRCTSQELLWIGRNRFAYKRASGIRGVFRVPSPWTFLRNGLRPRDGERSLRAWRGVSGDAFERPEALALYPDALDHSQIASIDAPGPRLLIGPKERANLWKLAARGLGLFGPLTPSFAFHARRKDSNPMPTGLERILADLAERLGVPAPRAAHVISSRGSNLVVLTQGTQPSDSAPIEPIEGSWCLHIPLNPAQGRQVLRHARRLKQLASRHPSFPAPRLLGLFSIDGTLVCCETRIPGWNATQVSGDSDACASLFAGAAAQLADLAEPTPTPMDEAELQRLLGQRIDIVCARAHPRSTERAIRHLGDQVRERLTGRSMPRVLMHADLRSKHVQVTPDGTPTAYLDWGCASWHDLPYFDLLHLIAHEAKQAKGLSAGDSWKHVQSPAHLGEHERSALDIYAERLGLDEEIRGALVLAYPILVAAQAESHWDYSRPTWLHRQFRL